MNSLREEQDAQFAADIEEHKEILQRIYDEKLAERAHELEEHKDIVRAQLAEEFAKTYENCTPQRQLDLESTIKSRLGIWNPFGEGALTSQLIRAQQALDVPGRMTMLIYQAIACTPCVQKPLHMLASYLNSPLNPAHAGKAEHSEICLFLPVAPAAWMSSLQGQANPPALPQVSASPTSKERLRVRVEDMFQQEAMSKEEEELFAQLQLREGTDLDAQDDPD